MGFSLDRYIGEKKGEAGQASVGLSPTSAVKETVPKFNSSAALASQPSATEGRALLGYSAPVTRTQPKHRTAAEINFDISHLKKKRDGIMREAMGPLRQIGIGAEFSSIPAGDENKKLAAERYGKAGEVTGQIKALEEELEQVKAAERKRLIEEEGYRDASPFDLTVGSGKRGYYNSLYGQESYKDMMGGENDKEKYAEILAGEEYKFLPDATWQEVLSKAAGLLGQKLKQVTDWRSLAAAAGTAGMAFEAGQMGPQIALAEETITVPMAFSAGLNAGAATSAFEMEAGFAYNEMINNGISKDTAKMIALAVGGGGAALEAVPLNDLIKSFQVLKKFGVTEGLAGEIEKVLFDYGIDIGSDTFQSIAQEGVAIGGVQAANMLEKGEWAYDSQEVMDRLRAAGGTEALLSGVLNLPSVGLHMSRLLEGQNGTIGSNNAKHAGLGGQSMDDDWKSTEAILIEAAREMAERDQGTNRDDVMRWFWQLPE